MAAAQQIEWIERQEHLQIKQYFQKCTKCKEIPYFQAVTLSYWTEFVLSSTLFISASSVPPHVPSCEVPSSVFVGTGLELHCKDKLSMPPATYRWYKDNRALTATADIPYIIDPNKGTLVGTCWKTHEGTCEMH